MARSLTRREVVLLSGAAIGAVIWLWYAWGTAEPQAAAAVAKKAEGKRELAMVTLPVVHLDLLDKSVVRYDPDGRDLFKYSVRPPSWKVVREMRAAAALAAKRQKEAEEAARIAEAERIKRAAEEAENLRLHPPPPLPPQPPVISFKFLGFVGPPSARIAAFEENDTTFVAKAGEVVKKEFRIDEIKYESVVISYVNPQFKGQVRELPLLSGK